MQPNSPNSGNKYDAVDIPQKAIENGFENAFSEVIEKASLTNYNDPNCQHRFVDEEGGDDSGMPGHKAMVCLDCPVGIMVRVD